MSKSKNYQFIIFVITLTIIVVSSCKETNNSDEQSEKDIELKEKELALKEKELQIKEREMLERKQAELNEKENELKGNQKDYGNNKINLNGRYYGTIKDGTNWYAAINSFDGENFSGYNVIYWQKYPEGYKTNFTGSYNSFSGKITMYEDRNTKGAGKFIGIVSSDASSLSGEWYRYSDNGSFTWNLKREN